LNIDLEINKGRQDCKIGMVYMCGIVIGGGEGEWKRLGWGNMVVGLHILIQNITMKPLAIALNLVGGGWGGDIVGEN
jgi:hypothetical protein